jgi:hypothetical protein
MELGDSSPPHVYDVLTCLPTLICVREPFCIFTYGRQIMDFIATDSAKIRSMGNSNLMHMDCQKQVADCQKTPISILASFRCS